MGSNWIADAGRWGQKIVHEATGLSGTTLHRGLVALAAEAQERVGAGRTRSASGGRQSQTMLEQDLTGDISSMVEASTCGDPETPLLWTAHSRRAIANELNENGPGLSHSLLAKLLDEMDYSLQGNRKAKEGADH